MDTCIKHRDIETCAVYLGHGDDIQSVAVASRCRNSTEEFHQELLDGAIRYKIARRVCDTDQALYSADLNAAGSLIALPLATQKGVQGVLFVWHSSNEHFSAWHEQLMLFARDLLVQSILHARLINEQKKAIERGIRAVARKDVHLRNETQLRNTAETTLKMERRRHLRQVGLDELTGLLNRGEFTKRLNATLSRALTGPVVCSLLHVDIDRFRVINDAVGHAAGDRLILLLGQLLRQLFGRDAVLARLGNNEFGILLENQSIESATRKAKSLHEAVQALQFSYRDCRFVVNISVGVAGCSGDTLTGGKLLRMAYSACAAVQENGGGNIQVFQAGDGRMQRRSGEAHFLSRLSNALDENRFELYCQPIVPLPSQGNEEVPEPINYEILLRLQEHTGELMLPGRFLPIAERYGLSVRLDRWVIEAALNRLGKHASKLDKLGYVTINLSGHSVGNSELLEFIIQQLQTTGTPAHKICFEITETVAVSDLKATRRFIGALTEKGCQFALDDFGSGHASYLYLRDLPVDYLKIDGGFIQEIATDPVSLALVRLINDIGKILGKRTIAEHVENDATLTLLKEVGIDYVQGYFIGRPAPLNEILGRRQI